MKNPYIASGLHRVIPPKIRDVKPNLIITRPPLDRGKSDFDFHKVATTLVNMMPDSGILIWITSDTKIDGCEIASPQTQSLNFLKRKLKLFHTMIHHKLNQPSYNFRGNTTYDYKGYDRVFEYMYVFSKGFPEKIYPQPFPNARRGDVWTTDYGTNRERQYTIAADHIRTWTSFGDIVFDPMSGTSDGAHLDAAYDLNRIAIGIEMFNPMIWQYPKNWQF